MWPHVPAVARFVLRWLRECGADLGEDPRAAADRSDRLAAEWEASLGAVADALSAFVLRGVVGADAAAAAPDAATTTRADLGELACALVAACHAAGTVPNAAREIAGDWVGGGDVRVAALDALDALVPPPPPEAATVASWPSVAPEAKQLLVDRLERGGGPYTAAAATSREVSAVAAACLFLRTNGLTLADVFRGVGPPRSPGGGPPVYDAEACREAFLRLLRCLPST